MVAFHLGAHERGVSERILSLIQDRALVSAGMGNQMIWQARVLIHGLFLFSGATALVYQVTWLRNLTLIFGASFQATSILLASFMAGLCLGGFLFGRISERVARPLRIYGLLEIGIAGFALALPSLLSLADDLYVSAALAADGVTPGLNVVRAALAFGILLLPTLLMGATLPVLTSRLVDRHGDFGARLSWLYGINTLGAVVGAVATGFVLIPALGVWHSQLLAVGINVGIGVLAIAVDRRLSRGVAATELAPEPTAEPPRAAAALDAHTPVLDPAVRLGAYLAFLGTAVGGMCALALEVLWTRAVSISVGTTTYSFTVMLTAFLVGIWLGSWLHAVFPLRRIPAHLQLGVTMVIIGLASFAASYGIPRLPELVVQLNFELYSHARSIRPATTLLGGFAIMLVPCVLERKKARQEARRAARREEARLKKAGGGSTDRTPVESFTADNKGQAGAAKSSQANKEKLERSFNSYNAENDAEKATASAKTAAPETASANAAPNLTEEAVEATQGESSSRVEPHAAEPISFWQMPQSLRDGMPEFKISVLVYAENPKDRFLLINGQRLLEKEELDSGVVLDEIRPDRAVFHYRKYKFFVKG